MNCGNPFSNAGGSPAAGYFFLPRQEKVTKKKATPARRPSGTLRSSTKPGAAQLALRAQLVCELRALDSDSRSVEREGAQAAARCTVNWSDIDASSRHKFH